jgi:hypothetical protein
LIDMSTIPWPRKLAGEAESAASSAGRAGLRRRAGAVGATLDHDRRQGAGGRAGDADFRRSGKHRASATPARMVGSRTRRRRRHHRGGRRAQCSPPRRVDPAKVRQVLLGGFAQSVLEARAENADRFQARFRVRLHEKI